MGGRVLWVAEWILSLQIERMIEAGFPIGLSAMILMSTVLYLDFGRFRRRQWQTRMRDGA